MTGLGYTIAPSDIAAYASGAGCPDSALSTAVAIAMAESSGGNPYAHNPKPPDDSYGLWQINMLGPLGPQRRAAFGLRSNSDLYDPATNARAMYAVSNGCTRWTPWTTYTSGAYRKFLGASTANPPDATTGLPGEPDTSGSQTFGGADASAPEPSLLDPGVFPGGIPMWAVLVALGFTAWVILR